MELRILGPLELHGADGPIALSGRHASLLARLAVAHGDVVAAAAVSDDLWPGHDPDRASAALLTLISRVRAAVKAAGGSPAIVTTKAPGYVLGLGEGGLDADRFEEEVAAARALLATDPAAAGDLLRQALSRWRGPAFGELGGEPWALGEATRLEQVRLAATEDRLRAELAVGRHVEAAAELESLCAAHPLREQLWGLRMTALYRSGRQAEALRAYQEIRAHLVEEIGIDPSPELRRLEAAILRQDDDLAAPAPTAAAAPAAAEPVEPAEPAASTPATTAHRGLPVHATTLVGRESDVTALGYLVDLHPVVTLAGEAGCGKTRLAVELARRMAPSRFPGGVVFVDVEPVREAAGVPGAVASALGLRPQSGVPLEDLVAAELTERPPLLLLDNCEHLIDEVARLVSAWRDHPGFTALVTSREPLAIDGERVWRVQPLPVADSVQLLVDRSLAAAPDLLVDATSLAAATRLCEGLDGLPLAVELAAARASILTWEQIADRLDDRFRLLAGGNRTAAPRHRALETAIDWSYSLLDGVEQAMLRRLAVFAGGWSLEAAEAVAHDLDEYPLDVLGRLAAKSLVSVRYAAGDRDVIARRYGMLESIRQYALGKLEVAGETAAARACHLDHFLALATERAASLHGPRQLESLDELELEHDNLRHALAWSVGGGDPDHGLELAAALGRFWAIHSHFQEGRRWLDDLLAAAPAGAAGQPADERRIDALTAAALLAWNDSDVAAAVTHGEAALAGAVALGDLRRQGWATNELGIATECTGDHEGAARRFAHAVELGLAVDDRTLVANGLCHLAITHYERGDEDRARDYYEEGLALFRELGDTFGQAKSLNNLGILALYSGRRDEARAYATDSLELNRRTGNRSGTARALGSLGRIAVADGAVDEAERRLTESLEVAEEIGESALVAMVQHDLAGVWEAKGDIERAHELACEAVTWRAACGGLDDLAVSLELLSRLEHRRDHDRRAAVLLGAAGAFRRATATPLSPDAAARHQQEVALLEATLGDEVTAAAMAEGSTMGADEVVALALCGDEPASRASSARPRTRRRRMPEASGGS